VDQGEHVRAEEDPEGDLDHHLGHGHEAPQSLGDDRGQHRGGRDQHQRRYGRRDHDRGSRARHIDGIVDTVGRPPPLRYAALGTEPVTSADAVRDGTGHR
jgi:hypothetical protein